MDIFTSPGNIPIVLLPNGDKMQAQAPKNQNSDILSEFKYRLEHEWKRTNFENKVFYVRGEIYQWMVAGTPTKNAVRLLVKVNLRIRGGKFPEIESSDLFKPEASCFIVFAILLSLDYGHLIHLFHKHNITDHRLDLNLEEWKDAYQAIHDDLKSEHLDPDTVIAEFEERKWAFNPVPLTFMMHNHLKGVDWVLPFVKCRRLAEGGTATIYQVLVQEESLTPEFRKAISAGKQNHESLKGCYEFAIKEYTKQYEADFKRECHAFMAIRDQKGMVQFLGQFVRDRKAPDGKRETTYNILLEYGEFDLEEFFGEPQQYPPVLQGEIVLFWESFFKVADAISRVHNLTITTEDGQIKTYNGWHADIKPENILRVYGEFKLADFGFAKFSDFKRDTTIPTSFIDGGTATYGAPETDSSRRGRGTLTPVSQTIDTWSFGCVMSITATWVILGVQGVYQYQQFRKDAIFRLPKNARPSSHDAFHDGHKVLPEVQHWHQLLRASMRKCDPITDKILDFIEERMLIASPIERIQFKDLCKKLDSFLEDAKRACHRPEMSMTITQDLMTTLLEFDRRAPSTASEANEVKAKHALSDTLNVDAYHEELQGRLAVGNEPMRPKSKRFSKPDRQVIVEGKFAHRASALQSALGNIRESSEKSTSIDNDVGKKPDRSHTGHTSFADRSSSVAQSRKTSSVYDHLQPPEPLEEPEPLTTSTPAASFAWQRNEQGSWGPGVAYTDVQRPQTPPDPQMTEEPHEMTPQVQSPEAEYDTSPVTDTTTMGPLHIQLPAYGGSGPSATPRMLSPHLAPPAPPSRPTTPIVMPKACPRMSPYRHLNDCDEAICKERIRLDRAKKDAGFLRKPKKDEALKDLIKARDFIFVVDRAPTMVPYWEWATFLVETLAMKLARLDDDGLDLVFTSGDGYNLKDVKDASSFRAAMEKAEPSLHSPKTDMSLCLGELSRSYLSNFNHKKLTLIIITDGMWGLAGSRENPVDKKIVGFINQLMGTKTGPSKVEDRWFSIQFVSFATDPQAHAYLRYLDRDLFKAHDIPDVIDTKPWNHPQVHNLILGSFHPFADDDSEDEAAADASSQQSHAGPSAVQASQSLSPSPSGLGREPSRSRSKRKSGILGGLLKKT